MSEAINNTDYLYGHLPARMVRDDAELFLRRFLTPVGEALDSFDEAVDTFAEKIAPDTSPNPFVVWWLYSLFGWGWFPVWFTLADRRAFYANITRHYAERGTLKGIQSFLAAFGLRTIVEAEGRVWDEQCFDEDVWSVDAPLGIVVRVFPEAPAVDGDLEFYDDLATLDESIAADPGESVQRADVEALLRFLWPIGNIIIIEDLQFPPVLHGELYGEGEYGSAEYGG
jgi:phage tail-like protein